MLPEKWAAYRAVCTLGEEVDGTPPKENPADDQRRREFVTLFREHLQPPARVLAPGALAEALLLAELGYEVHALQLPGPNIDWLTSRRTLLDYPERLVVRARDAHDLDYPPGFFDGYFSVQFHEHLLSPFLHIGEVRACSRVGAVAFVDACGITNPDMRTVHHVNLVDERTVCEQWVYWGWKELWRGPLVGSQGETGGDDRPQFVFQMLGADDPAWKHGAALSEILRRREAFP